MSFEFFSPVCSYVNKNEKQIVKKKLKKEMVWRYSRHVAFPHNLVLIRLIVSEKMGFTDGRTTDARVMACTM